MATGKDAYKRGFPQPTVEFVELELEPRRAAFADGGDAFGDVGPRHVEELERERRVEGRAGGAQPVVERELRVRDRRLRAGREPARDLERASPRARRPARRARRGRCARLPRRRSARRAAGGTSPSPARRGAARRSLHGRRRRRRGACGRRRSCADGAAMLMSASNATASPAPTAGPSIAATIGLLQLTML